jgi:SAM-dependent methyltransferase
MPEASDWSAIARSEDPDDVREQILTGYKAGKPFTPYEPTIPLPAALGPVLDFGCGLGRNFPYLTRVADRVSGFDLPPMIERCRTVPEAAGISLFDDWAEVKALRFDLIVASLVLQHIDPVTVRARLDDFAPMTPLVYLLSRTDSDFGTNVFREIHRSGLFEAGDCVEVEHDPVTHQLRVLGRAPLEDVGGLTGVGHYEVLLRSKAFCATNAEGKS